LAFYYLSCFVLIQATVVCRGRGSFPMQWVFNPLIIALVGALLGFFIKNKKQKIAKNLSIWTSIIIIVILLFLFKFFLNNYILY